MRARLELDRTLPPVKAASSAEGRSAERLLAAGRQALLWTPVWVPIAFLAQLVVLGWLPTRAEAKRLDRAQEEVQGRAEALVHERDVLAEEARMLADEVYQERVRRSLRDPNAAPLTLERARAASRP
jgi:hypothetical protein